MKIDLFILFNNFIDIVNYSQQKLQTSKKFDFEILILFG